MSMMISYLVGAVGALATLYLCYLGGMSWQFETMVNAQQPKPRVVTLAIGRFGATDQEIQECYFNIGQGAMLTLHPKGDFCQIAREQIGKTGTLLFVPD